MPDELNVSDGFERMFAEMNTPEAQRRFELKAQFVRRTLYSGLPNCNTGFDSPQVTHLSPEDFLVVIDRSEALGVTIYGLEIFTTDVEAPTSATPEDIEVSPEPGYDWSRRLVQRYCGEPHVTASATFGVPDELLESSPNGA